LKIFDEFKKGLFTENPVFYQVLGNCPTLAVTNSLENGIFMGIATIFVLIGSSTLISMLRKLIPKEVRMPCYIVVVATFVTLADIYLRANYPAISKALGPYVPLIVVNCIILARAEAYASKNSVVLSFIDALGMGVGFTLALIVISTVREIIGNGTILGMRVMWQGYTKWLIMMLPPGAFLTMGLAVALYTSVYRKFARAVK